MIGYRRWLTDALLVFGSLLHNASVASADNPIVQDIYTADPAPMVHDGRLYVFTGHDEDGATWFDMHNWRLFSTSDMANWQHHPSPMSLATFSWASENAWAGQVIARNDKFYYYVPVTHGTTGSMSIGVGVSDNIAGPYVDALGGPIVENGQIDPTVFIDDDDQAYLYWGNPGLYYVKLNEDMVTYSGDITQVELTTAGFGTRDNNPDRNTTFEEAPWLYKRDGIYYMIYAANCCPEDIRYSTGPSATGPWTYRGLIMSVQGGSFTNHPGIIDYKGNSYFFYHNGALPGGSGWARSAAVEKFVYGPDGSIPEMNMTTEGPPQIQDLNPYVRQEAETIAWSEGIETELCDDGGINVALINDGDYIKVKGVGFGRGAKAFSARVASATTGGNIELRLNSANGTVIGNCSVPGTGGWQTWTTVTCPVTGAWGTHDLFFRFTGTGTQYLFNFDWWQFKKR